MTINVQITLEDQEGVREAVIRLPATGNGRGNDDRRTLKLVGGGSEPDSRRRDEVEAQRRFIVEFTRGG
jgi:hypothetical protein